MLGTMLRTISVPIAFPAESTFNNTLDGWSASGNLQGAGVSSTFTPAYATGGADGGTYLKADLSSTKTMYLCKTVTMPVDGHMKVWISHNIEGNSNPISIFVDEIVVSEPEMEGSTEGSLEWFQVFIPISKGSHDIVIKGILNTNIVVRIDNITFGY